MKIPLSRLAAPGSPRMYVVRTRGAFFESPENISTAKGIDKNMNNPFYKAVILTYPYDKKYLTSSKVTCLETSLLTRYSVGHRSKNRPEKFRGFRETHTRLPRQTETTKKIHGCQSISYLPLTSLSPSEQYRCTYRIFRLWNTLGTAISRVIFVELGRRVRIKP